MSNGAQENWISRIGVGQALFVLFVVLSVLVATISCITHQYWLTALLQKHFVIHVFNDPTRMYFEALAWTVVLTAFQFYKYHVSTLTLYDAITIDGATRSSRIVHHLLQALLSSITLLSALILSAAAFRGLYLLEIMNLFEVNFSEIMDIYLPWLNLDYLIFCFVLMDTIILLMNWNYASCERCSTNQRSMLSLSRQGLYFSIVIGFVLCLIQFAITSMYSAGKSQYVTLDNLTVDAGRAAPLWLMIFLQVMYVITDIWRRAKEVSLDSGEKAQLPPAPAATQIEPLIQTSH